MSNTQRVSVELKNGKFRLVEGQKTDDLNPKSLMLYAAAECAGLTIMGILNHFHFFLSFLPNTHTLQITTIHSDKLTTNNYYP